MPVTATQLRKELFTTLDKAIQGQTVEISYKGSTILLRTAGQPKLARVIRRPTIMVDPNELAESDMFLMDELEKKWAKEAEQL